MSSKTVLIFSILFCATYCTKKTIPERPKTVCGTPGWPQGNWKVKCVVSGQNNPDSVSFDINGRQTKNGTFYLKKFSIPNLPLADSTNFCGDQNSDINVRLYSIDTTKIFYFSIFINNQLVKQDTGHTYTAYRWTGTGAQCK